ncbi:MAG: Na/Pi symporter [Candidatus Latescibacterota bacterium]
MRLRWIPIILLVLLATTLSNAYGLNVYVSGGNQEGVVGRSLSKPLSLTVKDDADRPISGLKVRFRIVGDAKGAQLTSPEIITDEEGTASIFLLLGKEMGDYTVHAEVLGKDGKTERVSFTATAVDWKKILFYIIGGLGLFLFGMRQMSDGLQKVAGSRMKQILGKLTANRFMGVGMGALVTGIIQSSSAMTVMTVGFVNAGLLTLGQAISVVMGANIGTTLTGQLIAFPIDKYALPLIGIGVAMHLFGKRKSTKFWGQVLLGFGILFLGLSTMTGVVKPLHHSQTFKDLFVAFSHKPWLGVLAGTLLTMIVQSSSATVALTMALTAGGLIDINGAIPLILGDNIGTTITAEIAAIGTNLAAKRTARAHSLFNIIGVSYMLLGIYFLRTDGVPVYYHLVDFFTKGHLSVLPDELIFEGGNVQRFIANSHSIFNVINNLAFIPLFPLLVRAATLLTPGKEKVDASRPRFLERHLLSQPEIALDQATKEIVRMAGIAQSAVSDAMTAFQSEKLALIQEVENQENVTDHLQTEITGYLVELSQHMISEEGAQKLPVLLHTVNDLERIGDHAINIAELAERKVDQKIPFTDEASRELETMHRTVQDMMGWSIKALEGMDKDAAEKALMCEHRLNKMEQKYRQAHVLRLSQGDCAVLSSVLYVDMVYNFEKIGDHLSNITEAVLGGLTWEGVGRSAELYAGPRTPGGELESEEPEDQG